MKVIAMQYRVSMLPARQKSPAFQRGFSLIELAIVMLVIGLLVGGLLAPLTAQIDQQNINETRKSLAEIREAIIGFAMVNGRLPCPALGSVATTTAGAGTEAATPCVTASGVLPWATLGLRETDAWGRRYTYQVRLEFADAVDATTQVSFTLASTGNITINQVIGGSTSALATAIPAIVISHGKNGYGAYTPSGGQVLPADGGDANEDANTDGASPYVEAEIDFSPDTAATFDDIVVWISPNILFSRMVAAGRLP